MRDGDSLFTSPSPQALTHLHTRTATCWVFLEAKTAIALTRHQSRLVDHKRKVRSPIVNFIFVFWYTFFFFPIQISFCVNSQSGVSARRRSSRSEQWKIKHKIWIKENIAALDQPFLFESKFRMNFYHRFLRWINWFVCSYVLWEEKNFRWRDNFRVSHIFTYMLWMHWMKLARTSVVEENIFLYLYFVREWTVNRYRFEYWWPNRIRGLNTHLD